jgi:hypothetical protein
MCCGGFIHNFLKLGFQWSHEWYPLLWCRKLKNSASRGSRLSYFSHRDVGSTHVTHSFIKNGMYYMYSLAQSASSTVHSFIIPPPNYTYPLKPPPTYNPRRRTRRTDTKDIIYKIRWMSILTN